MVPMVERIIALVLRFPPIISVNAAVSQPTNWWAGGRLASPGTVLRNSLKLLAGLAIPSLTPGYADADLAHVYTFNYGIVNDLVGGANGSLHGNASINMGAL